MPAPASREELAHKKMISETIGLRGYLERCDYLYEDIVGFTIQHWAARTLLKRCHLVRGFGTPVLDKGTYAEGIHQSTRDTLSADYLIPLSNHGMDSTEWDKPVEPLEGVRYDLERQEEL